MSKRRKFGAAFKAQVVLAMLSGSQSAAEVCREHRLSPQVLTRWKTEFVEQAADIFQADEQQQADRARIAQLERLVGQLTLQLEIAKKASLLLPARPSRNGS